MADTRTTTLRSFISCLDRSLSARAMYEAARRAGYETTMASIYTARTALGVAKPRSKFERKTPLKPPLPPLTDFVPPSDELVLAQLLARMGLDRARPVFERMFNRTDAILGDERTHKRTVVRYDTP